MKNKAIKIPKHESQLVEFKSFLGGLSNKEIARTLCAFANTNGGDLYIGVSDSGEHQGILISPKILDQVQNAAREGCSPPVIIKLKAFNLDESRALLKITTPRSDNLHSTVDGQTYVRVGTQDKRVLGDELLRLAETKSQASYEDKLLNLGIEVLDLQALEEYSEARLKKSLSQSKLSAEDLLVKIGLAAYSGNTFRIKVGAFILFGKAENPTLLQRELVFVLYKDSQSVYSYRENINLPLTKAVNRIIELLRPINSQSESIVGIKRQKNLLYPEGAIREVLLNSIAHRDYRIQGLHNEIKVFQDRIEFISAGSLPGMITLENLETQHYSRNPRLMHALLTLGYVEELGQGIDLIKKQLKENGNPEPIFENCPDIFKVTFLKKRNIFNDEDKKKQVYNAMHDDQQFSRSQLEARTGIKSTSLKNILAQLAKDNLIKRIGKGKATRYLKV